MQLCWQLSSSTVEGSWWWAEELPETCRFSWQNKFCILVLILVLLKRRFLRWTVTWTKKTVLVLCHEGLMLRRLSLLPSFDGCLPHWRRIRQFLNCGYVSTTVRSPFVIVSGVWSPKETFTVSNTLFKLVAVFTCKVADHHGMPHYHIAWLIRKFSSLC
jgi:hypothetical protein